MTIAATLTLDAAAGRRWGAVVVGAGPAGATAARELARRGVAVLLVDRAAFPRWKVCGCCLNRRAIAVLEAVGLGDLPTRCGAVPLTCIQLAADGRQARVPLAGGVSLSREAFDAALVTAAIQAGAAFLPQTKAVLPAAPAGGCSRIVELHQGETHVRVEAALVLAADGLGGALLARAGVSDAVPAPGARIGAGVTLTAGPDFYQPGAIYMACGVGGYVGLVRLEDGRLDVAAAFDAEGVRDAGGPGAAAGRLLRETSWPLPESLADLPWRGTPALTRQARIVAAERVFALGDAAGYVEPFTGEGMAWALASGAAVAPLAVRAVADWRPELLRRWGRIHRRVVGRRQYACRAAAAVLRRPWLTGLLVRLLSRAPVLAAPYVRVLESG